MIIRKMKERHEKRKKIKQCVDKLKELTESWGQVNDEECGFSAEFKESRKQIISCSFIIWLSFLKITDAEFEQKLELKNVDQFSELIGYYQDHPFIID